MLHPLRSCCCLLLAVALLDSAAAHHSFAMFDNSRTVTLTGTVKEFQYTNPHSWIKLLVQHKEGEPPKEWSIEGGPPNRLGRMGWKRTSLLPGDKVTVSFHPLRNGGDGGSLVRVRTKDGQVLEDNQ